MSKLRIHKLVLSAAVALMSSGCALPDYYTPGGYSSTYQHRLSDSKTEWTIDKERSVWQDVCGKVKSVCIPER